MLRPGRPVPPLALAAAASALLALAAPAARATDCEALRAAVEAADAPVDRDALDAALQGRRDEILRARATAERTGCGDGWFDDPDAPTCRALARRVEALQADIRRLQARASGADGGRRAALQARLDAECGLTPAAAPPDGPALAPAAPDGPAPALVPVDPDAPPPGAPPPRAAQVFCVRRCDGAYYPLASDVPADRMADMDRMCQAQCPAAEASAYAGAADGDVSGATGRDGAPYSALANAFRFQKGVGGSCACRAPHQSWAEALAGAEALLPPGKGDVTVTAELAAAMARPAAPPAPAPRRAKGRAAPPPAADPAGGFIGELRRGAPTP